ncbi:MAG TPA: polyphosphate polymerase domain-containing protein [Lachnospiraceae bacterium]|nr:polyphosphate polymerase domain-containing protein [Lachnospiraceae bacterium]
MNELTMRHELKHYINYCDYLALRNRLKVIAKQDSNVTNDGTYRIRSLYFDNYNDKALKEKLYGVNQREKFRIRYYNDNHDFIRLEKKSKIHGLCSKVSSPITREECERILRGDIEWMKVSNRAVIIELYAKMNYQLLRPKTIVDYTREPYIYEPGNVRVTIDSKLRTGIYQSNLFDQEAPTLAASEENIMILEVKYDDFLPQIIEDIIQVKDRRATAFSKYVACRVFG